MNNAPYLIDTHCHLHYSPMYEHLDEILTRARANNIQYMVCVSVDMEDYRKINPMIARGGIGQSVGVHPLHAKEHKLDQIVDYLNNNEALNVVAVGETGLDNFREPLDQSQIPSFEAHIKYALEHDLPIIMHSRSAPDCSKLEDETMQILRGSGVRGVAHCFGGSLRLAEFLLDIGWYISFAGNLTYKKASELQYIAKQVPIERMLIETDAPFLAPEPYRGKSNEPAYVTQVAAKIAELKNLTIKEVTEQLYLNTKNLFRNVPL